MQRFKEIWELVTAVIHRGAFAIGGTCLLVVCVSVGWFPEDMTVGDGVALYFISIGVVLAYAAYWLGITAFGLWLLRWPMELLHRFDKKAPSHAAAYAFASFKSMWSMPVWIVAGIAVIFVVASSIRLSLSDVIQYLSILVLQGFLGGLLLVIRRRLQLDASGLSLLDRKLGDKQPQNMGSLRQVMYAFLGIWLLAPMLLGLNHETLTGAAFRLAQLRKDHATVHVAAPWSQRLADAGLKPHESFLGTNHARFENVTVRMRSIGSRVVIEVPSAQRKARFVNIPRGSIEIE
jgi:hypothetical protein